MAQLVARIVRDDEVAGSNPATPTNKLHKIMNDELSPVSRDKLGIPISPKANIGTNPATPTNLNLEKGYQSFKCFS